jgi:hypothetical protein
MKQQNIPPQNKLRREDTNFFNTENVLWEARLFQGRVRVTEPSSGNAVSDACTMLAYNYVLSEGYDVT